MPFNGSGVYSAPAADFPAVTQTVISSTHYNNVINDIATALSTCLTKDGQQTATANIPFGGFRATNVGITAIAGSVGTPAINVSDTSTGLYRSAVSELAVSIAGTQRARFDSTGLIVTGAASVSTTLTASTSVVTPLVGTLTATDFSLLYANTPIVTISGLVFLPGTDNTTQLGLASKRWSNVFTPSIDSGTTGSLRLQTNNGTTQVRVDHVASAVNLCAIQGAATGGIVFVGAIGSDADVELGLYSNGTDPISFRTTGSTTTQFQVLHTASANRNITITGSNGGNPTIGVTAGSLAITPDIVAAASIGVGGSAVTLAGSGAVRLANLGAINFLNTSSANATLIASTTINAVTNLVAIGTANGITASAGVQLRSRSAAGVPTTSDIPAGEWCLWRDTSGATTKLYYNNAGAIQSVALA